MASGASQRRIPLKLREELALARTRAHQRVDQPVLSQSRRGNKVDVTRKSGYTIRCCGEETDLAMRWG
jgi:hypothetical protein